MPMLFDRIKKIHPNVSLRKVNTISVFHFGDKCELAIVSDRNILYMNKDSKELYFDSDEGFLEYIAKQQKPFVPCRRSMNYEEFSI